MRLGAWFHNTDDLPLSQQVGLAASHGLVAARSYDVDYAVSIAPTLRQHNLSLLAGIHVDPADLLHDWRSQERFEEVVRYLALDVPLDALCIGNELREGGDAPDQKRFTPDLASKLASVINAYKHWLRKQEIAVPLTYAMESIVFDEQGGFYDWMEPLLDACDIVSLNAYPMDNAAWFTFEAFEESRRFLCDPQVRRERLALFERKLRQSLNVLHDRGKRVFLSETGFPSAVGCTVENGCVLPHHDPAQFAEAMSQFVDLLCRINADYDDIIETVYFYEWRDNLRHSKIWNVEQSPIHVAFGLCDAQGSPKLDIRRLVAQAT